jgi:hypothetical protein
VRSSLVILDAALEASIQPARWLALSPRPRREMPAHDGAVSARSHRNKHLRMIREALAPVTQLKRQLHGLMGVPSRLAEVGWPTTTAAILIGQTARAERFATDAHFERWP